MFKVYHSNDLEILAELGLHISLSNPLLDKDGNVDFMQKEVLVVQSDGMKTYIYQKWAEHTGICTLLDANFLWGYVWKLGRSIIKNFPEINPFDRNTLLLNLISIFENKETRPKIANDPDFAPLHKYLNIDSSINENDLNNDDSSIRSIISFSDDDVKSTDILEKVNNNLEDRIYTLCKLLSDIYDKYQIYRMDWIDDWDNENKEDRYAAWIERINRANPKKPPLNIDDFKWQAKLWHEYIRNNYEKISEEKLNEILTSNLSKSESYKAQPIDSELYNEYNSYDKFDRRTVLKKILNTLKDSKVGTLKDKLPNRIFIYGINSFPPILLDIFIYLGRHIDVHFMNSNPCSQYWADLSETLSLDDVKYRNISKLNNPENLADTLSESQDYTSTQPYSDVKIEYYNESEFVGGNPLLLSYGKLGRDNLALLIDKTENLSSNLKDGESDYFGEISAFVPPISEENLKKIQTIDIFKDEINKDKSINLGSPESYPSLLNMIQNDIFNLVDLSDPLNGKRRVVHDEDRSVVFNVSSSMLREVQDLYDHLINLFIKDPSLKPREIIIMTPNITTYAPFIEGVFNSNNYLNTKLPYAICDRSVKDDSPIIDAIITILNINNRVIKAKELYELLKVEQIRERFDLDVQDLPEIAKILKYNSIIRGLNPQEPIDEFNLDLTEDEYPISFKDGLSRAIIGTLMPNITDQIVPYNAQIDGEKVDILAHLAMFVDKLKNLSEVLANENVERTIDDWVLFFQEEIFEKFFKFNKYNSSERLAIIDKLYEISDSLETLKNKPTLSLNIITLYLQDLGTQARPNSRFLRDTLNFCTFVPMRSIPFKHIMLLGMNENDFPRKQEGVSFDLMYKYFRKGDRSSRDDDRYMFLEAILAAQESLYISYIGKDVSTGQELNPSILVSELIDYIKETTDLSNNDKWNKLLKNSTLNVYDDENFIGEHSSYQIQWLGNDSIESFVTSKEENTDNLNTSKEIFTEISIPCKDLKLEENSKRAFADGIFINGLKQLDTDNAIQISLDDLYAFWKEPLKYFNTKIIKNFERTSEDLPEHESFKEAFFDQNDILNKMLQLDSSSFDNYLKNKLLKGELPLSTLGKKIINDYSLIRNEFFEKINQVYREVNFESKNINCLIPITPVKSQKLLDFSNVETLTDENLQHELDAILTKLYNLENNILNKIPLKIYLSGTIDNIISKYVVEQEPFSSGEKLKVFTHFIKLYLLTDYTSDESPENIENENASKIKLPDNVNDHNNDETEDADCFEEDEIDNSYKFANFSYDYKVKCLTSLLDKNMFNILIKLYLIGHVYPLPLYKLEKLIKLNNKNKNENEKPDFGASIEYFKKITKEGFIDKAFDDQQEYNQKYKSLFIKYFGDDCRMTLNYPSSELSSEELSAHNEMAYFKNVVNFGVAKILDAYAVLLAAYKIEVSDHDLNSFAEKLMSILQIGEFAIDETANETENNVDNLNDNIKPQNSNTNLACENCKD